MIAPKHKLFWPLALVLVLADCTTKRLAVEHLAPHGSREVLGDWLRFSLAYNRGAAMGLSLGAYSRVGFALLTLGVLFLLFRMYRDAHEGDGPLAAALALVSGGAIGNLIDRLRSPLGVVDFIDVGVGAHRFYIFNVADVGVSVGALLLAVMIWRRDPDGSTAANPAA